MKSKYYIAILLLITGISACRKEEATVFPDYDKNWLVVEDDPNDAATHARFTFYKETGIPVYINDTIGSQQRRDLFGKDYTYYEVLSMNYSLGVEQVGAPPAVQNFTYCSKADVAGALEFLRTEIMPSLPESIHVPSILLLKSFRSNAFGTYAYKGFNTILIGEVPNIPTMDATTKARFKGAVLRAMISNAVISDRYKSILERFYNASRKFGNNRDVYNLSQFQFSTYITGLPAGTPITAQAIGFISMDPRNPYYTPITTWIDVNIYLDAVLGNTEEQFKQQYGSYPNIMIKYGYIREILKDLGVPVR